MVIGEWNANLGAIIIQPRIYRSCCYADAVYACLQTGIKARKPFPHAVVLLDLIRVITPVSTLSL